ncbi:Elicitor-responsive protein 3 [Linum perenne]
MSFASGIQGQLLEVTVVGCTKLKDTEWISRQDPYVCVEYGSTKSRTRTCTDGGKNPTFQEKFVFTLIEGLRELNVVVWNSNTLKFDDFIGTGKVQLQKVLTEGYDDTAWPLKTKTGRHAGEVRLIMHYANAKKPSASHSHSAAPYGAHPPHASMYSAPPPPQSGYGPPPPAAPGYSNAPPTAAYPSYPHSSYPQQQHPGYPPQSSYPAMPNAYPQPSYPPHSAYPPPPTSAYPPPPQGSPYPPPGNVLMDTIHHHIRGEELEGVS